MSVYHCPGGPDVLRLDEVAPPQSGPGQLLISVAAVGVSLPVVRATLTASGPWPVAPGGEVAGRVAALGPKCRAGTSGSGWCRSHSVVPMPSWLWSR